jgi:hypothetical protein
MDNGLGVLRKALRIITYRLFRWILSIIVRITIALMLILLTLRMIYDLIDLIFY